MGTLRKRVKADGTVRWQAIVRKSGRNLYETFSTKAQAQGWMRKQEDELERRGYINPKDFKDIRVRDLMKLYIEERLPERKAYRNALVRFNYLLNNAPWVKRGVTRITPIDIQEWKNHRLTQMQPASVNRELNEISSFFSWCIKVKHVPVDNPVSLTERPKDSDKRRSRTFTWSEIRWLLKAMGYSHKPREYTGQALVGHCFLLSLRTAMRVGEVAKVHWKDIHLDERWLQLYDTKNGEDRQVPLSSRAVRLLERMQFDKRKKLVPVGAETLGVYFREARKAVGLDDVRFHDSRHHATTAISDKLANVLELSAVTGHKDLRHLKRYYNPKASALARKLD